MTSEAKQRKEKPPPHDGGARDKASVAAILCRDLRKTYRGGTEAVRGLDLEVHRGECFGLLGPNGAGKTTTIEILEGLLEKSSGEVEVLDRRWGRDDIAIRERIGVSLQETRLNGKLTVIETLELFRSFYTTGATPSDVLERVSLESQAEVWVDRLSGGQRQRLAVACALVGDPEMLFLDEPTTGLDPRSRREVWRIVRDFQERGRTVLMTTHYMDEAERLCNRVAIVDHGQIIALGSPAELISSLGAEHVIEVALEPCDRSSIDALAARLESIDSVLTVRREGDALGLNVTAVHKALPALLDIVDAERLEVSRLSTRHASLEDVFVSLTGRHLGDEDAETRPDS